jgi:NAD(P)-dependent dehydrogenase (short-subunit alcohol dehydrogenase family)
MRCGFDLAGQRILVTGAGRGIGAATAEICASLGAEMILVDLKGAAEVAERIAGQGGKAEAIEADAADRAAVERIAKSVGRVDGLVLNAAVCPFGEDWQAPGWDESFKQVIDVNVLGPIHAARAFLPSMIQRRYGRIVMVGSLAGRMGGLIAGPHYVASKGGLHALVKWLARQTGPSGVIVNGIAPFSVETPLMEGQPVDTSRIPLGRLARPEEVGWPIAFLCSPAASYICGVVLDVNGGVYMA